MSESIWTKLSKIDRKYIFLVLWIAVLLPFVVTFALPMKISGLSRDFYDYLDEMPEDSTICYFWDVSFAGWSEMEASGMVTLKMLFKLMNEKNCKIILVGMRGDCGPLPELTLKQLGLHPDQNPTYGEMYAHIGWIPGGSVGMSNWCKEIRSVNPNDWWGTPLDDLPVMQGINDITDIDLVLQIESGGCGVVINQVVVPYNTPFLTVSIANNVPGNLPLLDSGLMTAQLGGIRGGAELEQLTNEIGVGNVNITAISTTHLAIIALMVIANITYYARKARGEL